MRQHNSLIIETLLDQPTLCPKKTRYHIEIERRDLGTSERVRASETAAPTALSRSGTGVPARAQTATWLPRGCQF